MADEVHRWSKALYGCAGVANEFPSAISGGRREGLSVATLVYRHMTPAGRQCVYRGLPDFSDAAEAVKEDHRSGALAPGEHAGAAAGQSEERLHWRGHASPR
jgi:hypothetical protein